MQKHRNGVQIGDKQQGCPKSSDTLVLLDNSQSYFFLINNSATYSSLEIAFVDTGYGLRLTN